MLGVRMGPGGTIKADIREGLSHTHIATIVLSCQGKHIESFHCNGWNLYVLYMLYVQYALLFRNISEGVCCLVYISTFSLLTPVNKPKDKLQQQQKAIRGNKIAVAESSSSSSIAGAEGASQSKNQNHQQDGLWIFS